MRSAVMTIFLPSAEVRANTPLMLLIFTAMLSTVSVSEILTMPSVRSSSSDLAAICSSVSVDVDVLPTAILRREGLSSDGFSSSASRSTVVTSASIGM